MDVFNEILVIEKLFTKSEKSFSNICVIKHLYIYDEDNRLTIALTNNNPIKLSTSDLFTSGFDLGWEKDAKYFYYKHGPMARTEIGEDKAQGTDYAYTINGWLKGINATTLKTSRDMGKDGNLNGTAIDASNNNSFIGTDALGYTLGYFDGDYTSIGTSSWQATTAGTSFSTGAYKDLFNGNIARTTSAFMDNSETKVITMGKTHIYDQLNRLKEVHAYTNTSGGDNVFANNTFASASTGNDYKELFSYDPNGNITAVDRWGASTKMDEFTYNYEDPISNVNYSSYTNKLRYVGDNTSLAGNYTDDIDDQSASYGYGNENYEYDPIGNLIGDQAEEINQITWNVYGKVTAVNRTTVSNKDDIEFKYDPSGNRICKIVKPRASSAQKTEEYWTYTYYTRDAQGNVMAVYNRDVNDLGAGTLQDKVTLKEHDIYSSSHVGIETKNVSLGGKEYTYGGGGLTYTNGAIDRPASPSTISADAIGDPTRLVGDKQYELKNHLQTAMVIVTDKKIGVHTSGSSSDAEQYMADIVSSSDNFSFGATTPGRRYNTSGSEFGFNGKREDNEIYGEGNAYDFGSRINDPRLGRFLSRDPQAYRMASQSPYNFAMNCPVMFVDKEGENPHISITINPDNTATITVTTVLDVVLDKKHTQAQAASIIGSPEDLLNGDGCTNQVLVNGQYYEVTYNFVTTTNFYNTKSEADAAREKRGYGATTLFSDAGTSSQTVNNVITLAPPSPLYPGDVSHEIGHDALGLTDTYVHLTTENGAGAKAFLLDQNGEIVKDLMNDAASPLTDADKSKIATVLIQQTLANNTTSYETTKAPLDIIKEDALKAGLAYYGRVDKVFLAHHPNAPLQMRKDSEGNMEVNRDKDGTGTRTGKYIGSDGKSKTKTPEKSKKKSSGSGHMNVRHL